MRAAYADTDGICSARSAFFRYRTKNIPQNHVNRWVHNNTRRIQLLCILYIDSQHANRFYSNRLTHRCSHRGPKYSWIAKRVPYRTTWVLRRRRHPYKWRRPRAHGRAPAAQRQGWGYERKEPTPGSESALQWPGIFFYVCVSSFGFVDNRPLKAPPRPECGGGSTDAEHPSKSAPPGQPAPPKAPEFARLESSAFDFKNILPQFVKTVNSRFVHILKLRIGIDFNFVAICCWRMPVTAGLFP